MACPFPLVSEVGRSQARGGGDPSGEYAEKSRHGRDHLFASAGRLSDAAQLRAGTPGEPFRHWERPPRPSADGPNFCPAQAPARARFGDNAEERLPLGRRAFLLVADPAEAS